MSDNFVPPPTLAQQLEFTGEHVRDALGQFLGTLMPVITDAYRLAGEAELTVEPERDDLWDARARRTFADLGQVKAMLDSLHVLLTRDDPVVEAILERRRG